MSTLMATMFLVASMFDFCATEAPPPVVIEEEKEEEFGIPVVPDIEEIESSDLRFAVAVAQNIQTYKKPNVPNDAKTVLNILTPYKITKEEITHTDSGDRTRWLLLEDTSGRELGWVPEKLLYIWNNRHGLQMSTIANDSDAIYGYCDRASVNQSLNGVQRPCSRFNNGTTRKVGRSRAPFLVVNGAKFADADGIDRDFLEVLVPTHYSNLVPQKGGAVVDEMEVILLIDASSSMRERILETIEAVKGSLRDVEGSISSLKIMPIAYRDLSERSNCLIAETLLDGNNQPRWVGVQETIDFLDQLNTCETLDYDEALWDVLYYLQNIQTSAGAARSLVVIGDAGAHAETRGGTIFGKTIPKGLSHRQVSDQLLMTLGVGTKFIGVVVNNEFKLSTQQLLRQFQFHDPEILDAKRTNVEYELAQALKARGETTRDQLGDQQKCEEDVFSDAENKTMKLFCGNQVDPEFAKRVADIHLQGDDIAIRKIWIGRDASSLNDVILLSKQEAINLRTAFQDIGGKMNNDGNLCKTGLGQQVWIDVVKSVTGASVQSTTKMTQPTVSDYLRKYWRVHSQSGSSLLNKQPSEITQLTSSECVELGGKLLKSADKLSRNIDAASKDNFVWFPLVNLP